MSRRVKELESTADICDVCERPIPDLRQAVTVEVLGDILTFCSEECHREYLKDPLKYAADEEVLE